MEVIGGRWSYVLKKNANVKGSRAILIFVPSTNSGKWDLGWAFADSSR
jgi:hypothetical protein